MGRRFGKLLLPLAVAASNNRGTYKDVAAKIGCTKWEEIEMAIKCRKNCGRRVNVAMLAFGLAACTSGFALAQQNKPAVYVIAPSLSDPFWITQQNGAKQAGQDFGVSVAFEAPASRSTTPQRPWKRSQPPPLMPAFP
jgi:hypothetical protein